MNYYLQHAETLKDIFNTKNLKINNNSIIINDKEYPIINDVIVLDKELLKDENKDENYFSKEIQQSFSHEWETYNNILEEHEDEFKLYFDIVDEELIRNKRVADLGCGIGRWSYFLAKTVKELILIDFSRSIFVARKNLKNFNNTIFFMGDITKLPFKENFADFVFSLGVLHHIPQDTLQEIRKFKNYASYSLIFIYYKLDNRPVIWRFLLKLITIIRLILAKIENKKIRIIITKILTYIIYLPLIKIGDLFEKLFSNGKLIPLYEFYKDKSIKRIEQDVYDRFFTSIEKRFSKKDILENLKDHFSDIVFSNNPPYWHFLLKR